MAPHGDDRVSEPHSLTAEERLRAVLEWEAGIPGQTQFAVMRRTRATQTLEVLDELTARAERAEAALRKATDEN